MDLLLEKRKMFKLHRHRSDRLGERVEFRFSSFQAFQIPKGWDRLILSLVSLETGKTVAKANKATVRSGTCQWTETFSESIWILQEHASQEIGDCLFKLVVSMGTLRTGILGELTLNLTDYMSSRDSGSLSLPLQKCNYGTIFQIRIQCLNPKSGFRDGISSKEKSSSLVGNHANNAVVNSKSGGSDNVFDGSLGSSPSNHSGVAYQDEHVNRETSFSASGSHRSSDSGDSSVGRLNYSPRNNLNGASYTRQQDSPGSHISVTYNVGPTNDFSRLNPSSFNSRASGSSIPNQWQESTTQIPISLRPTTSAKDFLEAAEETIEELQDEAKMWERHAQKLKLDVEKFKKESLEKSKRQAELDIELSAAKTERDSLKQEIEFLKSSLEEVTTKQNATRASKNEVILRAKKELEGEVKFLEENNSCLNIQLKKSQEANIELVSILEELEETVEKQKMEIAKFTQQSPVSDYEDESWNQKLVKIDAEWAAKLSEKEEEFRNLEKSIEMPNGEKFGDLVKEIEVLRRKVQELESDCAELTDENLELIYKLKESGKGIKEEKYSENPDSEIDFLESKINVLEDELKRKDMLNGGMKNMEKRCADLEVELQYFKDQACYLDSKLSESQLEMEGKISELSGLQRKLESFQFYNLSDVKNTEAELGKEIDVLRNVKEELEVLVTSIQKEKNQYEEKLASAVRESSITSKCLEDVQCEMMLLASSVDSHASTNKILERKLMELESSNNELEIRVSVLEEDNAQLSESISGLEVQLRYVSNEKESIRLELEDSRSLVEDRKDEASKQQAEIEVQKEELEQKLQDAQKRISQMQEGRESLARSNSTLQSTIESLIKEKSLLQQSNGDLQRQKVDLHDNCAQLEAELIESQEKTSGFLERVEFLESKLFSLQNDIVSKEKMLILQLDSIFKEHEDQEDKINQAKLMQEKIDFDNTVEIDNIKRENTHLNSQLCATHDEREKMASDAVLEVSNLRSDKIKLENSLNEARARIKLYESELQSLKHDSGKKVQGLVDLLNASKQSEQMLMSDMEHMQRQAEAAKSCEDKFRQLESDLELKLKSSDNEKQQIMEKMAHLQDEILVLQRLVEEAKAEKERLEELLQSISEECEGLKTERRSFTEKISNMEKALQDAEDERCGKIALEEKLRASYEHETELKNEIDRFNRDNSEYQRMIESLKEEKCELMSKAQASDKDENKLHDLEATIKELEVKIHLLETELAESVEMNNMYKIQLQGLDAEKQSNNGEVLKKSGNEHQIASLETELKEMQERYLNMSLQYAEVEAQREQLVMKLKTNAKGKAWF